MIHLQKYRGLIYVVLFCLAVWFLGIHTEAQIPRVHALSAVLMDGDTGRVLYGKEQDQVRAMASTTKIMTAILILENCDLEEEVTISKEAAGNPKVKLYLRAGETYTVNQLLHSMLLESHNDSAYAVAEHLGEKLRQSGGDWEGLSAMQCFLRYMNGKAMEIGCKNTNFLTPNGLDILPGQEEQTVAVPHQTTAVDLATMMRYCLYLSPKKDVFQSIACTRQYSFCQNNRQFTLSNKNALLSMYEGVLAGKTGFTTKAGYCYVCGVNSNGKSFIISLLGSGWPNHKNYKWEDVRKLLRYGDENYELHSLSSWVGTKEEETRLPVFDGEGDFVSVHTKGMEAAKETFLLHKDEKVKRVVDLPKKVTAPITEGQKVGEIRYMVGDTLLCTESLVAGDSIKKKSWLWYLGRVLRGFLCRNEKNTFPVAAFMVYYHR